MFAEAAPEGPSKPPLPKKAAALVKAGKKAKPGVVPPPNREMERAPPKIIRIAAGKLLNFSKAVAIAKAKEEAPLKPAGPPPQKALAAPATPPHGLPEAKPAGPPPPEAAAAPATPPHELLDAKPAGPPPHQAGNVTPPGVLQAAKLTGGATGEGIGWELPW